MDEGEALGDGKRGTNGGRRGATETEKAQVSETFYSQWHLARNPSELRVTEFEYAMLRVHEAFARWVQSVFDIVSETDLSFPEITILHVIRMRRRPKTATQIARIINREDIANVQYVLRKLEGLGLIEKAAQKQSKTQSYVVTARGEQMTDDYGELRRRLLMKQLNFIDHGEERLEEATRLITMLTGIYEELSRTAASYNRKSILQAPDDL